MNNQFYAHAPEITSLTGHIFTFLTMNYLLLPSFLRSKNVPFHTLLLFKEKRFVSEKYVKKWYYNTKYNNTLLNKILMEAIITIH